MGRKDDRPVRKKLLMLRVLYFSLGFACGVTAILATFVGLGLWFGW